MMQNSHIKVTLTPKLRLEQALMRAGVEDQTTITHLTVDGYLNYKDFLFINEYMCETLQKVDMSNASVEDNVIGRPGFDYCIALTSVAFPETITVIGNGTFSGCENLTSIVIPASVTEFR